MPQLVIIDTTVANIASLKSAFARIGVDAVLTGDQREIESAELVVLPGVGSFAAGMERINELGVAKNIVDRIQNNQPTLAVCLGLQLLCESSEESCGILGLGILPVDVKKFPADQKVPQLGWNHVEPLRKNDIIQSGFAYFANSFAIQTDLAGWHSAVTEYGVKFVSAIWRGRVLACQFHPELSGKWGLQLLKSWAFDRKIGEPLPTRETTPC